MITMFRLKPWLLFEQTSNPPFQGCPATRMLSQQRSAVIALWKATPGKTTTLIPPRFLAQQGCLASLGMPPIRRPI